MFDFAEFERKKKGLLTVLKNNVTGNTFGSPQTQKNQAAKKQGTPISKDLGSRKTGEFNSNLKRPLMLQKIHQNNFFNRPFSSIKNRDIISKHTNSFSRKKNIKNELKDRTTIYEKHNLVFDLVDNFERNNLEIAISVLKNEQISDTSETKKTYYLSPRLSTLPINSFQKERDLGSIADSKFKEKRTNKNEESMLLSKKSGVGAKGELKNRIFKKI